VARARLAGWLDEKLTVGANCLKSVMLDDEWLACCQAQNHGSERGPCNVDDFGFLNESPKPHEAWLADDAKWKGTVLGVPNWSLRDERDFKLWRAVRIAQCGKTARQRENDGLDTADTRRKEVRID